MAVVRWLVARAKTRKSVFTILGFRLEPLVALARHQYGLVRTTIV